MQTSALGQTEGVVDMANCWVQTKTYRCTACGARYLHDKAHQHHCYECPARPRAAMPQGAGCRNTSDRLTAGDRR